MSFAKTVSLPDGRLMLVRRVVNAATLRWEICAEVELQDGRILSQLFGPMMLGGATLDWARVVVERFGIEQAEALMPGFETLEEQLTKEAK